MKTTVSAAVVLALVIGVVNVNALNLVDDGAQIGRHLGKGKKEKRTYQTEQVCPMPVAKEECTPFKDVPPDMKSVTEYSRKNMYDDDDGGKGKKKLYKEKKSEKKHGKKGKKVSGKGKKVRFASFNASLNRFNQGDLARDLSTPDNEQAKVIASIIQLNRPDVLLVNEFDYDEDGTSLRYFQDNYLSVSHPEYKASPIYYPYRYAAPSNTGIPSGFDYDNNGEVGGGNDAYGFGFFPGQFAMALYSMYPIHEDYIRTFQKFKWKDMPCAFLPIDPENNKPWYTPGPELDSFRLSSKSHWDIPIKIDGRVVHALASHPTPPVFDGDEDRNGKRNHDEIRFWADYISDDYDDSSYIYDDKGYYGGLDGKYFVILGDLNADPFDGDSFNNAARQLTDNELVNNSEIPSSVGAAEQSQLQGQANNDHCGDPQYDTADFNPAGPGNLRVDYALPSATLDIVDSGVYWLPQSDPLFDPLVGTFPFPSSDLYV